MDSTTTDEPPEEPALGDPQIDLNWKLPFQVWTLDPHYYQYSHEQSGVHGTYATVKAALEAAREKVRKDAAAIAQQSDTLENALTRALNEVDMVWIEGPDVRSEEIFDAKREASDCIRDFFANPPHE